MIKRNSSGCPGIKLTLLTFFLILVSFYFLDRAIAFNVMNLLRSIHPLQKATEHIPDLLPYLVGIGTIVMWTIYFYRKHKNLNNANTQFLLIAGAALPAAYILKTFFRFVFGRTGPRDWLLSHRRIEFHWFHNFTIGSFPSGHMTVFAAFGAAVLIYFPQYRKPVYIFLTLLGAALIGTDYHFLSDVIAGAYLGFVTTCLLRFILDKPGNHQHKSKI